MSNFVSFVTLALGLYFSLFLFWKFLHDDYEDSDIFMLWAIALTGGILGFSVVNFFLSEDALFAGLVAAFVFGTFRARKLKMKMVEVLESAVPSLFLFLLFVLLSWSVSGISVAIITEFVLSVVSLTLFLFFKSYYRRFLWYPSGKPGFASLATVATYFITRAIVAFFVSRVIFLDLVLISQSATLTFGLFIGIGSLVLLYIQSGRRDFVRLLQRQ